MSGYPEQREGLVTACRDPDLPPDDLAGWASRLDGIQRWEDDLYRLRQEANARIGEGVRKAREAKGVSLAYLAERLGVPELHLDGLEQGAFQWRLSAVNKAMGVLAFECAGCRS